MSNHLQVGAWVIRKLVGNGQAGARVRWQEKFT